MSRFDRCADRLAADWGFDPPQADGKEHVWPSRAPNETLSTNSDGHHQHLRIAHAGLSLSLSAPTRTDATQITNLLDAVRNALGDGGPA